VPLNDERVTLTAFEPVLYEVLLSIAPVSLELLLTVALLVSVPPEGNVVMRAGIVMVAVAPLLSAPIVHVIDEPATAHEPLPAGAVLL